MDNSHDLASCLNKRITLQEEVQTPDGAGGYSLAWQDVTTIWAEFDVLQGSKSDEVLASKQQEARSFARVTIRYVSGVTAAMRVVYGVRVFNILGVINPGEANEMLELLVAEGVAI